MRKSAGIWWKAAGILTVEALVLAGAWAAIRLQTREVDRKVNEISDLKDPSPFRIALLGHLDKIHLSVDGYVRSHDPSLAQQVARSSKDFELSLPEFTRQNPRLFPPKASEEIKQFYDIFKGSVSEMMKISDQFSERRDAWDENFRQILYLIEHRLRPLLRKDSEGAEDRLETLLNVENQLRAWQQNLAQAWESPSEAAQAAAFENESRGGTFLDIGERDAQLTNERKALHEAIALWKKNGDIARATFALGNIQSQTLDRMKADHQRLQSTLDRTLPPMRPEDLEIRKAGILRSIRLRLLTAGLIGLAGAASAIGALISIVRLGRARPAYVPPVPVEEELTLTIGLRGQIKEWTEAAEKLYGYTLAEMDGESISKLFASESEIGRLYHEMQSGKQLAFETSHKTKDGRVFAVSMKFRSVTDAKGRPAGVGLICRRR